MINDEAKMESGKAVAARCWLRSLTRAARELRYTLSASLDMLQSVRAGSE